MKDKYVSQKLLPTWRYKNISTGIYTEHYLINYIDHSTSKSDEESCNSILYHGEKMFYWEGQE
ncbi:hypothetical protein ABE64_07445 [Bacillus megaterium]|nr:hypothetical protein [Priestia megaterium]